MRAFLDAVCLWTGRVVWILVLSWLLWAGICAVYNAGVASGRAQVGAQPTGTHPQQAAAPARRHAPPAPAQQVPPERYAVEIPPQPPPPSMGLTIEIGPTGACRIGVDVPRDPVLRERHRHQRRQLGLEPCN
jgi:hypothetical protein